MEKKLTKLQARIEELFVLPVDQLKKARDAQQTVKLLRAGLNSGVIRAAQPDSRGTWKTNAWVKQGILISFRLGVVKPFSKPREALQFSDKDTLPLHKFSYTKENIRVVPGGTSVRDGSYIGPGVIMMPPVYVNIGAYVGEGTMLDSHSTAGSCAQIGKRCHISAGAQVGGVLEPVSANPCIVGDDTLMGINTSISEGVILGERVVLGAGVQITSSTPVYDLVKNVIHTSKNGPLTIPDGAVVVPGARQVGSKSKFAKENGLSFMTPIIAKYRDKGTDAKTALESALR